MRPDDYADGLGETLRGLRAYMSLSRSAMASAIGMSEITYRKIESGTRQCPPGLLDTAERLTEQFDDEVERIGPGEYEVRAEQTTEDEWRRAVVGRASAVREGVVPILVK